DHGGFKPLEVGFVHPNSPKATITEEKGIEFEVQGGPVKLDSPSDNQSGFQPLEEKFVHPVPPKVVDTAQPIREFIADSLTNAETDETHSEVATQLAEPELVLNDCIIVDPEPVILEQHVIGTAAEPFTVVTPTSAPMRTSNRVHTSAGISGILFDRDLGRDVNFATNGAGAMLSSGNNGNDLSGGFDVNFARRRRSGLGWEARYFAIYPDDETTDLGITPMTALTGLSQLGATTSGTGPTATVVGPSAEDVFNASDYHTLARDTELQNLEINLLRNTGPRFLSATSDVSFGFRYLQFDESLLYQANNIPDGGVANPFTANYLSSVENQMLGIQVGSRLGYRLGKRFMLHAGSKGGILYNQIRSQQRVDYTDRTTGAITNPLIAGGDLSGQNYNFETEKNVNSLFGEADLSVSYMTSNQSRVHIGYRIMYFSDVAFASNQIASDFTDNMLLVPVSDDELILHGGYFGYEFAF
ncbi:MAG: BBP7 family outer membrane beta-barrel protein, partial [Planctomycetota bacterium]